MDDLTAALAATARTSRLWMPLAVAQRGRQILVAMKAAARSRPQSTASLRRLTSRFISMAVSTWAERRCRPAWHGPGRWRLSCWTPPSPAKDRAEGSCEARRARLVTNSKPRSRAIHNRSERICAAQKAFAATVTSLYSSAQTGENPDQPEQIASPDSAQNAGIFAVTVLETGAIAAPGPPAVDLAELTPCRAKRAGRTRRPALQSICVNP